jgi:O-succinylbenzoate synthase
MAYFDLQLKRDRQSLAQWCGTTRLRVPVGGFLAIDRAMERDVVEQRVGELVERGIRQVRLKIQPGFDVTPVRWVNAVAPHLSVCVDANGSYRIDGDDVDGIPALLGLYEAGVTHVEQPFPASNLVDHAALRSATSLRVCLDEGVTNLMAVRKILQYGAADALCVKPGRVGGILATLEILRLGREHGLDCFIGGFFETGFARAHLAALAAHEAVTLASDLSSPATYGLPAGTQFRGELVADMPVPQGVGIAGGNDEWITSASIAWEAVTL